MEEIYLIIFMIPVFFIQSMTFTWVSRSRNSGNPTHHRMASLCSNGVWFISQMTIIKFVWKPIIDGDWLLVVVAGTVYVLSSAEGSVFMMKVLLDKIRIPLLSKWFSEKGNKQVGAR